MSRTKELSKEEYEEIGRLAVSYFTSWRPEELYARNSLAWQDSVALRRLVQRCKAARRQREINQQENTHG